MQVVNLENLSRKGGVTQKVDWVGSVGKTVKFTYDDINGEIIITSYNKSSQMLEVSYENKLYKIKTGELLKAQIGYVIGKINKSHYYSIGDIVETKKSKLEIIDKIRVKTGDKTVKGYKYKCLLCNNIDKISEYRLKEKQSCNVCSNKKVLVGYNDIHTTHKELGKLCWNYEDGLKYTAFSQSRIDWKCLNCGSKIENKFIYQINTHGLSCPSCSDGKSIPEKFVFNVIKKVYGNDFEYQKSFSWSKINSYDNKVLIGTKVYDFYIPKLNCIIEVHGMQHYKETTLTTRTLEDEQENDRIKESLARENNIVKYIVADCRYSDFEYMRVNLLSSEIGGRLNILSDCEWKECYEQSLSSLIKTTCEMWNSGNNDTKLISKMLKLDRSTVINYLKKGSLIGWCDYNPKTEQSKNGGKQSYKSKKHIVQLSTNGELIRIWHGGNDITKEINIDYRNISAVCHGRRETSGGYKWMFLEDYNKLIETKTL